MDHAAFAPFGPIAPSIRMAVYRQRAARWRKCAGYCIPFFTDNLYSCAYSKVSLGGHGVRAPLPGAIAPAAARHQQHLAGARGRRLLLIAYRFTAIPRGPM